MNRPRADFERDFREKGFRCVAGIDEVGRGALAGPVVAAAVVLSEPFELFEDMDVCDSKLLSPAKREEISEKLLSLLSFWAIGEATVSEIDSLNIRRATFLAMKRAMDALPKNPDLVLVDGREIVPSLGCRQEAHIGGDRKILSIAAASIIAKVYRDKLMSDLDRTFAGYGFADNKGYGTAKHKEGLLLRGISSAHRAVFCKTFLAPSREKTFPSTEPGDFPPNVDNLAQ
ncbi:MAG: ribonuclease HII [Nitrospirae bacterium]|jgi:ribonuclease HII|nr:ribonuclease HII [Nitrospirota bacterium]